MTKLGIALLAPVLLFPLACKKESTPTAPPPAPAAPAVPSAAPAPSGPVTAPADGALAMSITEEGFVPSRILAKAGQPLVLAITRKTEKTCATEILFHGQEGKTDLPLNKTVQVTYTPKSSGPVKFGCAMGMMIGGVIEVSP